MLEELKPPAANQSIIGSMVDMLPLDYDIDLDALRQEADFEHLSPDPEAMDADIQRQLGGT